MDLIFLLAPTSTVQRMAASGTKVASGYVYYVSLKGVTGSLATLDTDAVEAMLPRIRQHVQHARGGGLWHSRCRNRHCDQQAWLMRW
jgi:tryptophan synthase alpha chain